MTSFKFRSAFLFLSFFIPIVAFVFAFVFAAHAQNPFNIQFPVAELGGCNSIEECFNYCEDPSNAPQCRAWAEANGFAAGDDERHEEAQEILEEAGTGPGGCSSPEECDAFCSDQSNEDECFDFAVEHGFIDPAEAEKIRSLKNRGGPGGCRGDEECRAYCSNPANQLECVNFAVENGFMSEEEASRVRLLLSGELPGIPRPGEFGPGVGRVGPGEPQIDVVKAQQVLEELGGGPGGCEDFDACEEFCSTQGNEEICFDFAKEHGLMDPEEAEKFKKLSTAEGPGGCKGRTCEAYCEESGHERECLEFARAQGFIEEEEFEKINKFVTVIEERGGPGGCRGRACEAFCNNPSNRDVCFDFAKSNNLLPPQELERIEKFKELEKKVQETGGPGGCRGEAECHVYCSDALHLDECAAFAVNEGFLDPKEAEELLKQFIQLEQFRSSGTGGGFGPGGFGPGNFGPAGEGGFPRGFDQIPEQFRGQAEEQFKERFKQFEQFRTQFEHGPPPQGFPGQGGFPTPDQFPGQAPGGFPGRGPGGEGGFPPPQEFPSRGEGSFPNPDQFRSGNFEELRKQFEGGDHPAPFPGQFPDQNISPQISPQEIFQKQFEGEVNRQFEQEVQRQFQEEYQKQYEQQLEQQSGQFYPGGAVPQQGTVPTSGFQSGEFHPEGSFVPPPSGEYHPSEGSYTPPPTGSFESGGSYTPSSGDLSQPPPPSSSRGIQNFFANVLSIFNPAFR